MKRPNLSAKRIEIDKANASLIVIISITVFVVIFSIVASRSLFNQLRYQSEVINQKEITKVRVERNIEEVARLNIAYQEFAGTTTNVLGGNPDGSGDRDGGNARIILDALPSKYDFPALATSMDKLAKSGGFVLNNLEGIDDEVNQVANQTSVSPTPINMAFSLEASINPADGKKFLQLFERSIRPVQVQKITITAEDTQIKIGVNAETYYLPEKKLNVSEEVVPR